MSSSRVKIKLSDTLVDKFYSAFGGSANLSVTLNILLTILLDEAEVMEGADVREVVESIQEKLA